jgi:hypothetical protein
MVEPEVEVEEELLTTQVEPELQTKEETEETELTILTADVAAAVDLEEPVETELLLMEEPEEPEELEHHHLLQDQQ